MRRAGSLLLICGGLFAAVGCTAAVGVPALAEPIGQLFAGAAAHPVTGGAAALAGSDPGSVSQGSGRRKSHRQHVQARPHLTLKPAPRLSVLLGRRAVAANLGRDRTGLAQAFPVRTRASGTISSISVYLDSSNRASKLFAGLYSNRRGHPRSLLASGSLQALKAGAWNRVKVRPARVRSDETYWLAVLGRGGMLVFRGTRRGSCTSETSRRRDLTALPSSWEDGSKRRQCPLSAYASGRRTSAGKTPVSNTGAVGGSGPTLTGASGPTLTGEPIASGTVATGESVSTTNGSWAGSPTSYNYQWQRCPTNGTACSNISGATSQTYTVQSADSGSVLRAQVTATNGSGSSSPASSPMIPFGDNFANDLGIDTNIWDSYNHHGDATQPEPECYVPANLTMGYDSSLGANVMQQLAEHQTVNPCDYGPGQATGTASYASAETQASTFNWEYGTLKAKIEFAGGDTWPALWMDGSAIGQYPTNLDSAPSCNIAKEVDIAEINNFTQLSNPSTVSEEDNAAASCSFPGCSPSVSNLSSSYHIYEFEWTSTQMVMKIDGTTTCTMNSGSYTILNVPAFPMIDTAMNTSFGSGINDATLPDTTKVAWIYITTNSPSATATPTLTDNTSAGRFQHGDTIQVSNNIWGSGMTCGSGGVTCTYLWKHCDPSSSPSAGAECTAITGATSQTYTLASGDVGDYITASVTASTSNGASSGSTPISIAVS